MLMLIIASVEEKKNECIAFDGTRSSAIQVVNAISSKYQCEEYYDSEEQTIEVSFECDDVCVDVELHKGDILIHNDNWVIPFKIKRAK